MKLTDQQRYDLMGTNVRLILADSTVVGQLQADLADTYLVDGVQIHERIVRAVLPLSAPFDEAAWFPQR